jgi:hypothetical protein
LENLKREQIEEAENARHQHLKNMAHIEVTNASMSSDERLFHLNDMYEREKAEGERRKADLDLQLSESTKTLEALRAEYNTLKAMCSPEVMKLCEDLGDDEQFDRKIQRSVITFIFAYFQFFFSEALDIKIQTCLPLKLVFTTL